MSRIGKKVIKVPSGVKINVKDGICSVEGPRGKMEEKINEKIELKIEEDVLTVVKKVEDREANIYHGLTRALLHNCITGVSTGFKKELLIHGTGYKALVKGNQINFQLGFSHPIGFLLPEGVSALVKGPKLTLESNSKYLLGEVAAKIRDLKKPEPYKAKGIRYSDENIRRKQGKAGVSGGK